MPGEATEVGQIVGYLVLNRADWLAGVAATERDAEKLGRLNPDIRIQTNAGSVIAQLSLVNTTTRQLSKSADQAKPPVIGLISAIAAIAPAAAPIAAVLIGGLLGTLPVLSAVAFGVKGITDAEKSGQLQTSIYGRDLRALSSEGTRLKQIAGSGLLSGLHDGLAKAKPLFGEVNADTALMSQQIGHLAGGAVPTLVTLLTRVNPLFVTLGNELNRGAGNAEHWAQSSDGISKFVGYAQAELPQVIGFLGDTATLIGHISQASAQGGPVILSTLGLLVRVLNSIPIDVLSTLIPLLTTGWAAIKLYQGGAFIFAKVAAGIETMDTAAANAATRTQVSALATQAAFAEEAAAVAAAKAAEAEATAEASVAIAASLEGTTSILAAEATAAAEASIEFAAAMQAEADAAVASAATISASSAAAGQSAAASGALAARGLLGILGPAVLVAGALAFVTFGLHNSTSAAEAAAVAAHTYAESVKESTNALSSANLVTTSKNLADANAFRILSVLQETNKGFKLSYSDLIDAVNGSPESFAKVESALKPMTGGLKEGSVESEKLLKIISSLREGLQQQIITQQQLNTAVAASLGLTDDQVSVAASYFDLVGTRGVTAYLAARQALDKWIDSQRKSAVESIYEEAALGRLSVQLLGNIIPGFNSGAGAGAKFAQALDAYSKSAGTAADRGALVAAGLVAMQGDALGNAAAMANSSLASHDLVQSFQQQSQAIADARHQLSQAKVGTDAYKQAQQQLSAALDAAERGALTFGRNRKGQMTAQIDTSNAAAAPLIQQLQTMQDSGAKAAESLFDVESKTKGLAQASKDAAQLFKTQTHDALVKNYKDLGLTKDQAQALADTYFSMPKSFATKAELLGTTDVITVLNQLGTQLSYLTGHPWAATLDLNSLPFDNALVKAQAKLNAIAAEHITINAGGSGRGTSTVDGATAGGGTVMGAGGPKSDSVYAQLPNGHMWRISPGEEVIQNPYSSMYRPLLKAINNGQLKLGTFSGGRAGGEGHHTHVTVQGPLLEQTVHNPLDETASASGLVGLQRARDQIGGLFG